MPAAWPRLRTFILAVLFADLTAVAARVSLPLPPVPLTMQTAMVLLSGALLGPGAGAASQALYLAMGLAGLPVFALGGGPAYLLTPTFGYLAAFPAAAWLTGFLMARRPSQTFLGIMLPMLAGLAAIYAAGLPWLYLSLHWIQDRAVPWWTVIKAGLLIPLPGDILKVVVAVAVTRILKRTMQGFAEVERGT